MEYGILNLTVCLSILAVCVQGSGELNNKCRMVDDCRSFGYICARNRTCQCYPPIYIPNKDMTTCVGKIDQKCKYDEHCIEGAFCKSQSICKCKEDFYPDDDGFCISSSSNEIRGCYMLLILFYCCLRFYL